ncbi:MAG: sodium:alanine symporter family protein [Candidatus Marinimicrobia bacterium]|jgi:AGCS family alanine or glycine:cation symporter|nr:sodium:alanine symporter family protein [Candidatus Neomarinimicrobiota bacterium]HJM46968.1 sodium:alanine symporter family protein [Candidatus Neomarinimicrobiota bacterium]|tara:strand:- start:6449 stop:7810 length:1362 start_codon:yes stop_codon:yes gene_type:complete
MINFTTKLEHFTEIFSGLISMPLTIILIGTGLFVTMALGFIQLRRLKHSFEVVSGKYDNPEDEGDVTHFQALSAALSATIGIGNIAGVALAVRLGGPGALFWMWITALLGMALKYAECTLSHRYRVIHKDGSASGGPMYYIEKGLGPKWKPLAIFFATCAVICSFCTGNMNQANTIAQTFATYNVPIWLSGGLIAALVGLVIIGGIKRIAAVASKLVPTMAVLYVLGALIILLTHLENIIPSFFSIFKEAFSLKAGWGGLLTVIMWGVRRGLYSNEAGQGSAPIAHAAAKTKESAREGAVALMGPFIDTIVVCTMTGLAILSTGVLQSTDLTGAQLTREAFRNGFAFAPEIGSFIVNIAVLLFAYTTMVAWSYYGDRSIEYLVGPRAIKPYRWAYVFFNFMGAILPITFVWNFGDIALSLMTIPNLIGVIFLTGTLKKITNEYFSREHIPYRT